MSCLSPPPGYGKVRVEDAQSAPQKYEQKTSRLMEIVTCLFFRRKQKSDVVDMVEDEKQVTLPKGRKIHIDRSGRSRKALKMENMQNGPVHRPEVKSAPSTPCGTRRLAFLPSEHPTAALMSYLSPKDRMTRRVCSAVSRSSSASNLTRLHARQAFVQTQQQHRRHVTTTSRSSDIPLSKRRPWQMGAEDMNIEITKVSRTDKQKFDTFQPGAISDSKEDAALHSNDDIYDLHEEMRRMKLSNPNLKSTVSPLPLNEKKKLQGSDQELTFVHDQFRPSSASPISMKSSVEDLYLQTQQSFSSICRKGLGSVNKNGRGDEVNNKKKLSYMNQDERRLFHEKAVTREELDGRGWTMDEDNRETMAEEDDANFDGYLNGASSWENMRQNCFPKKDGENDFSGESRSNEIGDGKSCKLFVKKNPFDGAPLKVMPVSHTRNGNKGNLTLRKNNGDDSENGRAQLTKRDIHQYDEKEDEDDLDTVQRASSMLSVITTGDVTTDGSKLAPFYLSLRSQGDNLNNNSEQSTLQNIHTPAVEAELNIRNMDYWTNVTNNDDIHGHHIPHQIAHDESFSSECSETSEIMNLLKVEYDQQSIMQQRPISVGRISCETLTPVPNVSSTHPSYVTIPPYQSHINSRRPHLSSKKKTTLFLYKEDADEEEENSVPSDNMRMMPNKSGTNSLRKATIKSLNTQSTPPSNKNCIKPKMYAKHGQLQPLTEVPSSRKQNKNRLLVKDEELNLPMGIRSGAIFRGARTMKNVRLDPVQSSQRPLLDIPLRMDNTNEGNTGRIGFGSQVGYGTLPWPASEHFGRNYYSRGYNTLHMNHSQDSRYKGTMDSKPNTLLVQSLPPATQERKDTHLVQSNGYSVNDRSNNYDTNIKQEHNVKRNKDCDNNTKQNPDLKEGTTKTTEVEDNLYSSSKTGVRIRSIPLKETRRGIKLEWLLKEAAETEV